MRSLLLVIVLLATSVAASAADDVLLLPVYIQTQGLYESLFVTQLFIYNRGANPVVVHGLEVGCPTLCPTPIGSVVLEPGDTASGFQHTAPDSPGLLITVPAENSLAFSLHAYDTSRVENSAGTEIPVVRSSDFQHRVDLVGIKNNQGFRSMLRIYSLQAGSAVVRYRTLAGVLLADQVVILEKLPFEGKPAYAQVPTLPELNVPYRIEVETVDVASALWAFVSTTNNQTQEITLTTPQ